MTVLQYVGSIAKDYTNDEKPLKILERDGIKDIKGNIEYRFEPTNDKYERPYLDISQSTSAIIPGLPEWKLYYVDNDGYINKMYLYDYDQINDWYKVQNERLHLKAIINKPLHYHKDYDNVEWIYYFTDVDGKILCRFNVGTEISEKVDGTDMAFIRDLDLSTGYGIFDFTRLTDNNYIEEKSFIRNLEIEAPNNFYFTALAIKMAMAYKIKQGGDITLLSEQYDELLSDFYNSQSNDTATFTRMGNVY